MRMQAAGLRGGASQGTAACACTCRQQGCEEAEDVLRPYSALAYAWDEPALPHRLLLALPGNRLLGAFDLDKAKNSLLLLARK